MSRSHIVASHAFEEIWNHGNLDAVDEIYADDFVEHGAHPLLKPGPIGYKGWISAAVASFPYEQLHVEELYATGDKVAVRYVVQGCFGGADVGQRARSKPGPVKGCVVMRITGGQIKESWGTAKMMDLLGRCE